MASVKVLEFLKSFQKLNLDKDGYAVLRLHAKYVQTEGLDYKVEELKKFFHPRTAGQDINDIIKEEQ